MGDYHWRFSDGVTPPLAVSNSPPIVTTTFTRPVNAQGPQPLGLLGRANGAVELWDLGRRVQTGAWQAGTDEICVVTLSSNLALLATGDVRGQIKVWSLPEAEEIASFRPRRERVVALALAPDGRRLASISLGAESSLVSLWNLATGRRVLQMDQGDVPTWIAFSSDGRSLATCTLNSGEARLWNLPSGSLQTILRGHVSGVMRVAFSPDGKTLATGAFDGKIKLWSLAADQEVLTLSVPFGSFFRSLCFSPEGRSLAVGHLHAVGIDDPPVHGFTLFQAPSLAEIAAARRSSKPLIPAALKVAGIDGMPPQANG